MKKYDEIMNKIEVDEAMRKRIISYVENLNQDTEKAAKRCAEASEECAFPFKLNSNA